MTAQELRIGNKVWYYTGEGIEVTTIDGCDIEIMERKKAYLEKHQPIPISFDWLKSFGFIKDTSNGNYWLNLQTHYLELMESNCYWYPVYAEVPELLSLPEQRVSLNNIQYIHQLQNLYFALTETELVVKL